MNETAIKTNDKNPGKTQKSVLQKMGGQQFIVFLVVIALFILFSILSSNFRKYTTVMSILDYSYYIVLMSIGVTFPLITGGVDLSIGTGLICYSIAGGFLISKTGCPIVVGMLVTILFGILIGTLNGILVAVMELPPFLATLCTCMITRGLGALCSGGFGVAWPAAGAAGGWFRSIFKMTIGGVKVPVGFLLILILVAVMDFVLRHTRVGRYIIAIGSNKEAAMLSGINVRLYHILAYVISGLFAALAAIAYSAVFSTVQPGTGAGFELEAIGGAIIGGVSATGGAGSIPGALLGVLVICVLKTGLPNVGLQANWQQIITGMVLIGAVLIDIIKKSRSEE
ncbi:MAG: ABC transporter permease [Lachnospiraceae bacterium]|nr:ABC transporter permease [Lachnospiraceae bacterium]